MILPTQRQRPASLPTEVIHRITINKAQAEQAILPVKPEIIEVVDNRDSLTIVETVENIFERQKHDGLYRKILITCFPGEDLKHLKEAFLKRDIPVAYTAAVTGNGFEDPKNGISATYKNVSGFSKAITEYQGNIVILHIRQMTEGVDVSAITSVLTRVFDNTPENIVKMIQTNGRALRYMNGERGKTIHQRVKKYGEVFCMVNKDSFNEDARFLIRFFNVMYGTEAVSVFRLGHEKKFVKMNPPTIGDATGHTPDQPGDWSEAEFYLIKLIRDYKDEIQFGIDSEDKVIQLGILENLLSELDQVTQLNQTGLDMSWYSADHSLSKTWEQKDLVELGLFHKK